MPFHPSQSLTIQCILVLSCQSLTIPLDPSESLSISQAENKHEPMCDQKVVRKSKVTHVAFNPDPTSPILLYGDDRGGVYALKLSPNLRRNEVQKRQEAKQSDGASAKPAPKKKGAEGAAAEGNGEAKVRQQTPAEMEVEKLEKLLGLSPSSDNSAAAISEAAQSPAA